MVRSLRLPFAFAAVVLVAAIVTLIVRVNDGSDVGAAGDGVAAPAPDDDADAPGATPDDADDPVDLPDGDEDAVEDDADDVTADDDATDDGTTDDGATDPSGDGVDGGDRGTTEDGDAPDADRSPGSTGGAAADTDDGTATGTGDDPSDEAADDDQVLAAPDLSRDRVPGVDPLPDTGATAVALGAGLLAAGLLRRR